MADTLQQNISGTTLEGSSITSAPAKTEVANIQSAITNAQGLTAQQMGAYAEAQMQARVQAESKANPNQLITGGQTGALQTGTGQTPVTYQAYTYNSPSTTPKTAPEPTKTTPTATTPTVATPPDTAQKYVYDKAQGGYVPQADTSQADPGQTLIEQQRQMLQRQFNDAQQRINDQFNQHAKAMEGQLQTVKGASSMMLARMGAFQTSGSGIAYMNNLDSRHQGAMNALESERQYAISVAQNQLDDKMMELAWKSLERADQLKAQKIQEEKDYLDKQVKTMQMMQMSMDLAEQQKESAVSFMEGQLSAGASFEDVKDYVQAFYNVDERTASSMWNLAVDARDATAKESYEKQIALASSLISIADKMGTGVEIPLGDYIYTYQGFNADNIATGTETDISGKVKYWTLDKRTGDTKTYDLGIIKKEDGWSTVNLGENGVWAINAITGESKPFFASTGQQTWDQGEFATGQTGPALPGSSNAGQCGAMANYFYGKGVVGNELKDKLDPLREFAITDASQARPGMTFVQNIGTYGHIGFIEDVGIDPTNGKAYFTAFESNYNQDGKITHGRKIYFDDPTLAMISDYPAPKLPGVGSDAPVLLKEGRTAEQLKPLSASELKTFTDLGYEVVPGMTMDDVRGLKKTVGGQSLEIPSQEDFARDIQNALGQSMEPAKIQEMYSMTVGKIQPIADAAEVITTGMTAAQSKATISAINKAIERGDIMGAQQQLKAAAISSLPSAEATKVRGREVGIEVLQGIQQKLLEYKQAGGDTGVISGTTEEMAAKIGKVTDPEKRRLASQIRTALIDYRQSVSGAAFTESEMEEYKGLFPSISSSYDLNQAKIDGLIRAWSASNEATFRQIMTPSLYEQIWQ